MMEIFFNIDVASGRAHIEKHGVSEQEIEECYPRLLDVAKSGEVTIGIGRTFSGRILKIIFKQESVDSIFVITAYELTGKPLAAFRRRQRGRGQR